MNSPNTLSHEASSTTSRRLQQCFACLMILAVSFFGACSSSSEKRPRDPGDLASLQKLYDETNMREYRSWTIFPGTKEFMDGANGSAPHGRYVTVYVNDVGLNAVRDNLASMPDGTIIAKDAFDSDKELRATVIMTKEKEEWSFGVIRIHDVPSPEMVRFGKIGAASISSCTDCHLEARKDMVYAWQAP